MVRYCEILVYEHLNLCVLSASVEHGYLAQGAFRRGCSHIGLALRAIYPGRVQFKSFALGPGDVERHPIYIGHSLPSLFTLHALIRLFFSNIY